MSKGKFNSLGTPPKKAQKLAASVATDSDSALREGNRAPGKKHELVTAARAKQIRDFARSFKQLCDVYQLDVFASIDGDFIEIVERNVKYPNGYEYSGMMKGIYGGRLQGLDIEREWEDDEADAASVSAGSDSTTVRGSDRGKLRGYLRRIVRYAKGDDLERATSAFRGLSPAQMKEQHGQSGSTRQEILDNYRTLRHQHEQAAEYLESLLTADERTSGPNPTSEPPFNTKETS